MSWGTGTPTCGDPQYPGVYARVAGHLAWIQSIVPYVMVGAGSLPPAPPTFPPPPSPPPAPPGCACSDSSTGCLSNGASVSARCGCADHLGDGVAFCYVVNSANGACPQALSSAWVLGAAYRDCIQIFPPSPPRAPSSIAFPAALA